MANPDVESLYVNAHAIIDSDKLEKCDTIAALFRFTVSFQVLFKDNRNLLDALTYIEECLNSFIREADFEHMVMENVIAYIQACEFELSNEKIDELEEIFELLENLCDTRYICLYEIISYYDALIDDRILTDKNYFIRALPERISDEQKKKILACVGINYDV